MHKEYGHIRTALPFICEAATVRIYHGAGEALFDAFIKEYGPSFWLKCLDGNAQRFWEYMARKKGLRFRSIGATYWGAAILRFGRTLRELL